MFSYLAPSLGIDLGTTNTLVYMKDKGIIVREPSVVAMKSNRKDILAVGEEARRMIGRTPGGIMAVRPLKDGVIADFGTTEVMLRYFIRRAVPSGIIHRNPRVVVCVPCGITEVEKRAVDSGPLSRRARCYWRAHGGTSAQALMSGRLKAHGGGSGTAEIAVIALNSITPPGHAHRRQPHGRSHCEATECARADRREHRRNDQGDNGFVIDRGKGVRWKWRPRRATGLPSPLWWIRRHQRADGTGQPSTPIKVLENTPPELAATSSAKAL